jgi:hypothetical protein
MKIPHFVTYGLVIALVLVSLYMNSVSAENESAPLQPPFSLKITFDSDQLPEIENKNIPMKLSLMLGFTDGMIITIDKTGKVSGRAGVHSESSMGNSKLDGYFALTGTYKSGKITGAWTFSGKNDIPQSQEYYFVADRTFEGSGDFISIGAIDKDGGKGYLSGEMEYSHEECDKQDTDTRSPTFGACLKKAFHVDNETFEIKWTAVPVGDYCFNLRLKNDWEDSLARFNSLTSTVEVTCDPNEEDWIGALLQQELFVGDHIATREYSSAILQFADMNTYIMQPNTEIIIETPPEKETKIGLVLGRLWNNTKKLLYEGTMEIETTQAVAGIKGTTLVMETDGTTTTLKVIAGTVDFTSKITGETIQVSTGQQASADASGLSEINSLDITTETAAWLPYVEDPAILEPSEGAEYLPKDYFVGIPEIESTKEPGFLKKLWNNTLGRVCAGIFPGAAVVIFAIKKKGQGK